MKSVVEFIAFFAVLAGSMAIALWVVRLCVSMFATPDSSTWEFAYVSESPNAYCYHYSEQCNALRRTTYDIETLSVDEAEDYDYEPCGLCLKESVREKWDDAAGWLFIPVSCVIFGLINKIEQFSKKYKLEKLKYLLHFIGSLLRFAVISMIIAVLFGGVRYLLYLLSWVKKPTWSNVFSMALILWVLMILYGIYAVVRFVMQSKNDTGKWIWQNK